MEGDEDADEDQDQGGDDDGDEGISGKSAGEADESPNGNDEAGSNEASA